MESVYFIFSCIVQVTRQVQDGRELNARKLGLGDYYAEYSLLTGVESHATFTALTSGILLEWNAAHLTPILAARPEHANSFSHSMAAVHFAVGGDNIASLEVSLTPEQVALLDEASKIDLGFPHELYTHEMVRTFVYGGLRDRIIA